MARVKQIPFGAGAPQPTQQQVQRLQLAQRLMEQGGSTAPVYSPLEGIARLGHGALGGILSRREEEKQREREEAYSQDLSTILAGAGAKPWVNPDTGQTQGQAGGLAGMLASADQLQTPEAKASLQQMALAQALTPQAGPKVHALGGQLVDDTGRVIYEGKPEPGWSEPFQGPDGSLLQTGPGGQVRSVLGRTPKGQSISINTGDQLGKPPAGWRMYRDETGAVKMEPIAGGPAATESAAAAEKQQLAQKSRQDTASLISQDIGRAKKIITDNPMMTTGIIGPIAAKWGGSDAADVKALVDTIKANISFDKINAMRAASPTGGALGNVTERELELLAASAGNLSQSQSSDQLLENLARLELQFQQVVNGYGGGGAAPAGNTPAPLTIPIEYGGGREKGPIKVTDEASYNAVPSGATFIDPQGNIRTKR